MAWALASHGDINARTWKLEMWRLLVLAPMRMAVHVLSNIVRAFQFGCVGQDAFPLSLLYHNVMFICKLSCLGRDKSRMGRMLRNLGRDVMKKRNGKRKRNVKRNTLSC